MDDTLGADLTKVIRAVKAVNHNTKVGPLKEGFNGKVSDRDVGENYSNLFNQDAATLGGAVQQVEENEVIDLLGFLAKSKTASLSAIEPLNEAAKRAVPMAGAAKAPDSAVVAIITSLEP